MSSCIRHSNEYMTACTTKPTLHSYALLLLSDLDNARVIIVAMLLIETITATNLH